MTYETHSYIGYEGAAGAALVASIESNSVNYAENMGGLVRWAYGDEAEIEAAGAAIAAVIDTDSIDAARAAMKAAPVPVTVQYLPADIEHEYPRLVVTAGGCSVLLSGCWLLDSVPEELWRKQE